MGAFRESRKSERHFERVVQAVRNIDRLLWLGNAHHLEDIREYQRAIVQDLEFVVEERSREIQQEEERQKRTEIADKPYPPANLRDILGGTQRP